MYICIDTLLYINAQYRYVITGKEYNASFFYDFLRRKEVTLTRQLRMKKRCMITAFKNLF